MSAHTSKAGFVPMDRRRLARLAYTAAADRLLADRDMGAVAWPEARAKLAALRAAYDKRKEAIEFASFVRTHGLETVFGMEG